MTGRGLWYNEAMDARDHERITRELAAECGFPAERMDALCAAVRAPDTERDARGRKVFEDRLYHTKTCPLCDLRRATAERRLEQAVEQWRQGREDAAVRALGAGLHALQDLLAHGGMLNSVLLHRKRGAWAWLAPVQRAMGLRDIDDYQAMPLRLQRAIRDQTAHYLSRFVGLAGQVGIAAER